MSDHNDNSMEHIAIIGMAGRFPGAETIGQFWQNLRNGKHCLTRFSDEELRREGVAEETLTDPDYVKAGVVLENIDLFDADFFGYNARDAEIIDPQQRIFLEIAWEALENAGCNPDTFNGSIGVFGGTGASDYGKRIAARQEGVTSGFAAFQAMLGNDVDFLTTRVSYKLNLTGPSFSLQTACSTSLVAVHVACQHLLTYQCDLALAGGVSIRLPQGVGYTYRDGMIWSPDGFCRAFDAKAQGTIFGRGAGIVVLKRLSEAIEARDCIHAIIKGSAINNDGALKVGYTAPSVDGQAEVISIAQALSNTAPETIDYVETHGTGTKLGDPIEIEALTKAFRTGTANTGFCAIGSVKTNIGHLDVAAGIAGLIKTTLALRHGEIPPSLHFEHPNPNINFSASPFYVAARLQAWPQTDHPRRAGVSSFGIGGTNAHVILEEAPAGAPTPSARSSQLLLLSAKSPGALQQLSTGLADHFRNHPDTSLADAAYTLHLGRKHFPCRRLVVCEDASQAAEILARDYVASPPADSGHGNNGLVFMFSGQGSQYLNMCRGLYTEEPLFKEQLDFCAETLTAHLNLDLRDLLFPANEDEERKQRINQTYITQPALFAVEYSLARLLMSWGLSPSAMVGHSIGEYVAACLAGVFTINDALALVAARGRMMQDLEPGTMLAVPLAEDELAPLLPQELSIAVVNAPKMTVISGKTPAIETFRERMAAERGLECRPLHTSHAFHSGMMEPIVDKFTQLVASLPRSRPEIPFVSNLSGTWITDEQATSPAYWANHLRRTVRFYACVSTLLADKFRNYIEVGPGQVLTLLARQHPLSGDSVIVATTRRPVERQGDLACILQGLGQLWLAGVALDGNELYRNESRCKIPLPSCPFQRKKYWLGPSSEPVVPAADRAPGPERESAAPVAGIGAPPPDIRGPGNDLELQIAAIFGNLLGLPHVDVRSNFFDIGGDSLSAAQLLASISKACDSHLSLADIFENPSVEALASLIQRGGGKLRSTVLPLNSGKGEHLIYFVVGINIYHALAQQLNDTARCFGTFLPVEEALFAAEADQTQWKVADLAATYREEIAKHSQGRPLSLVGVSFGGVVAFELARQLSQAGQTIPLLVMLDSLLPSGMHRDHLKWTLAQTKDLLRHGIGPALDKLKAKVNARTQPRQRLATGGAPFSNPQALPDQRLLVYADAVDRFEAAERHSTYAGETLLIKAQDAVRYPGYQIDGDFGWRRHLTGRFHIDSAPGDHLGLLQPPHVQVTAGIMARILQKKT